MKFDFDAATEVTHHDGMLWTAQLDPGWSTIGGAPNGGYLMAVALAAAGQAVVGQRLLTATAHYLRPGTTGPATLEVEQVKHGRLTSTVGVALSQDGTERVRVLATYGDHEALNGPAELSLEPPRIPDPAECLAPSAELALRLDAHLALRFDYRVPAASRWVGGDGPGQARIDGWIRFSDGRDSDLAALPLIVDAFPPALGELLGPMHVPTLELTVHPRQSPSPGWIQARIESRQLAGGLVEEDAYLWDAKGRLVAMSRQLGLRRSTPITDGAERAMNPLVDQIVRAVDATAVIVEAIPADMWDRPTPCRDWDVRTLLNHVVGGLRIFTAELRGVDAGADHEADWLGADPQQAYALAAAADRAAWQRPGALDTTVRISLGALPGQLAAGIHLTEILAHGADLAVATGREDLVDQRQYEDLLRLMRDMGGVDSYRLPGVFDAEVVAPADAPAHRRLLAYLGRRL